MNNENTKLGRGLGSLLSTGLKDKDKNRIVKIAIKSLLTVVPTNSSTVDRSVTKYEDTVPLPNVSYSVIETLFNLDMRECLIL